MIGERGHVDTPDRGLYVHVPFCVRKCLYCDFVSYPYNEGDARAYLAGLRREVELRAAALEEKRWTVSTVFIGGGTPTCLSTGLLLEIISLIKGNFHLSPNLEFTVEANPGTVDYTKLLSLLRAGVNRLSLGAQSCSERTLRTLGRIHTHGQTLEAVRWAREAGFANVNLDLIFEVPGQSRDQWRRCLEQVVGLQPEHIAAYALQLEEGTPLKAQVDRGWLNNCDEETGLAMYHDTIAVLGAAGLARYEISNFARPGRECRHNLIYWHNGEYLGLGPAAHSRIQNYRSANQKDPEKYLAMLKAGRLPVSWSEPVTRDNDIFETVFLGLRLAKGLDLELFARRFGCTLEQAYPGLVDRLAARGMVEIKDNGLRLTPKGLDVSNTVMAEFVPAIT